MPPLPVQQLVDCSRQNLIPDIRDICEWESGLKDLRSQLLPRIAEAQSILSELLAEQALVDKSYQTCRSLLAPIRKLAPELLSYIFLLCLPKEDFVSPARYKAPLLFLSVCCVWRNVALTTTELWSSLRITHLVPRISRGMSKREAGRLRSDCMEAWFKRAGCLPLSMSMGCLPATDVLDGLIKYSSHCRHLNIETAKPPGIIQIPALIQFSKLETLYVTIHKGGQAALLVTPSSFPKLLGVRWEDWTDYKTRVIQPLPELPWESLRRLTLAYGGSDKLELREILNCLSQCNSLEYAEIRMNRCSATPRLPVLLPKLVTLVLDLHVGRLEIVNFLIAPNLRELTLCRGVLNIQDLTSFVDRSMFTLHTLTMRRIFFSNDSTTSLSECLLLLGNSLESLCIVHSDPILSITHLGSLTRTPGTQYLCPQLRELQLIGCVAPKLGALATMIRSRLSAIMQSSDFEPNLSSLRIAEFELDLPVLETFRRFGLNIIVTEVKNPLAVDL